LPIEIKINRQLNYTQVIIKAAEVVRGYSPFGGDPYNNIYQNKVLGSSELSNPIEELKGLQKIISGN